MMACAGHKVNPITCAFQIPIRRKEVSVGQLLAGAALLGAVLSAGVVWRWVGPGTPLRRSLLIAPIYLVAGVAFFLGLQALQERVAAYLMAIICGGTALGVILFPLIG